MSVTRVAVGVDIGGTKVLGASPGNSLGSFVQTFVKQRFRVCGDFSQTILSG